MPRRLRQAVLGCPIDVISRQAAVDRIDDWASRRESRAVYLCNAQSVVTGTRYVDFTRLINRCDLAAPDGMPVAWMMRRYGHTEQQRIAGPDLMLACCERAARDKRPIFLLGSTEPVLEKLQDALLARFPELKIAGAIAPPFHALSAEEDADIVERINATGARILFVGLGCPKQERWINAHLGKVRAVMIGVGAAFPFHAGISRRAPAWMQRCGLEWLHRLACEPRRLWRRYLVTNTLFIFGMLRDEYSRARARRSTGV